jgi:hypothetical protein
MLFMSYCSNWKCFIHVDACNSMLNIVSNCLGRAVHLAVEIILIETSHRRYLILLKHFMDVITVEHYISRCTLVIVFHVMLMRLNLFFCTDLSTLANVVTTLAAMGNDRDDCIAAPSGAGNTVSNGETSSSESVSSDQAAKAFDVLTKALQPQLDQVTGRLMNSTDQSSIASSQCEGYNTKTNVNV